MARTGQIVLGVHSQMVADGARRRGLRAACQIERPAHRSGPATCPGEVSSQLRAWLMGISGTRIGLFVMKTGRLVLDPSARTDGRPSVARRPPPARGPIVQLPAALQILTTRMRAAIAERRASPPGGERYRRADEEVAYLNELLVGLQRRMEIPAEVWGLERGRSPLERLPPAASRSR